MGRLLPQNIVRLFAPENRGTDLYLHNAGYDDFSDPHITPIYHQRTYNSYTLHFVFSGKGYVHLNGVKHPVEKNCLFFLPSKTTMAYYPDRDDPWEYAFFNFDGALAEEYGKRMGFSAEQPILTALPYTTIRETLGHLLTALQDSDNDPYYLGLAAFYEIVYLCCRQPHTKGAASARYVIDANYASPDFTVEKLCRELHISHSHLCRLFKETYGTTVVRYLVDRRLKQAKRLLEQTDLPIKAIAFSCGFSDELHFMKSFKAATGMTAGTYRRQL